MGSFSSSLPYTVPSTATNRCAPSVQLQQCTQPDNAMTMCLKAEQQLWSQIAYNPTFPLLRVAARYRALNNPPFVQMPQDGQRLNVGPITPTILGNITAGVYNPLCSYLVPPGFDGVINSTLNKFVPQTGPPLQDGSGMITWVLQINNYLAISFNNVTIQLGSNGSMGQIAEGGGIAIKANDLITFYAIVSTAGAAFLDPAGIILGAFQGWIYPNR